MTKTLKSIIFSLVALLIFFIGLIIANIPFLAIYNLPKTINLNIEDLDDFVHEKPFGKFISCSINGDVSVSTNNVNNLEVDLKIFNLISVKKLKVNTEEIDVYAGGDIVGFSLNGDGVVVVLTGDVETENGVVDTLKNSDIKKGDIIKKINGEDVNSVADICRIANKEENKNKELDVFLLRNSKEINTKIKSALDKNSKIYKLGLWVKDDASGIGTLTFIKKIDGRFGALGHAICDNDTKTVFNINSGEMYKCTIIGLNKGSKGRAGELKGLFMQGKNNIGKVDKNCDFGVYGNVNFESDILDNKTAFKAGGRFYAKPGKAYIRTAIDGKNIKEYEVEIVKTNYQSTSNEKSMVIKVTDKELLSKTGGIIQGMSGSPIIQDNRIIGAITHVFINDPTKGFGIYLDWMINQ